jgi:hypothetical protein
MKRLVAATCLALAAFSGVGMSTHTSVLAAGGGNSDAAHMCQQGGYANLEGTDGTTFQNAGQCTSYVARGGTIQSVPACIVSSSSGCITLTNLSLPWYPEFGVDHSTLGTITLTRGLYSFSPTSSACALPCGGAASGGGTYTVSSGSTFNGGATSGTFTVTGTTLVYLTGSTCAASLSGGTPTEVAVAATFTGGGQSTNVVIDLVWALGEPAVAQILDPSDLSNILYGNGSPASGTMNTGC